MERDIRALKREINASEALGMDSTELRFKLKMKMSEYRKFSDSANLKPKMNRLRVNKEIVDKTKSSSYKKLEKVVNKSQEQFETMENFRKGKTHRKITDDVEIIDDATYNKLIKKVKKNGGIVIRGTDEVEEHLKKQSATASCINDVILFSKKTTISDILEETYHFEQNIKKMNNDKSLEERFLLNEIDAQKYMLSVAQKYHIPEKELDVTRENLSRYEKLLEEYYEGVKQT